MAGKRRRSPTVFLAAPTLPWRRHEVMDGDGCVELGEIRPEGIKVRCEAGRNLAGGLQVALDGRALAAEEGRAASTPEEGLWHPRMTMEIERMEE